MAESLRVSLHDRLSRFIRTKNHIAETKNLIKQGAFLPAKDKTLSVFKTENLKEDKIWGLADQFVSPDKKIEFRADALAKIFKETGLILQFDNKPERHVNITGWPDDKHEQKDIALRLASNSKLIKRSK
jgi:hypothetical protein